MARPCKKRNICLRLKTAHFKPEGINQKDLSENVLEVDELEAMRLVDLERFYHETAAKKMGISRATLSNIIHSGHYKVAMSLIKGQSIRINCRIMAEKNMKSG